MEHYKKVIEHSKYLNKLISSNEYEKASIYMYDNNLISPFIFNQMLVAYVEDNHEVCEALIKGMMLKKMEDKEEITKENK